MKKKLLIVMPFLYQGGAEKQFRILVEKLKMIYEVKVVLLFDVSLIKESDIIKYNIFKNYNLTKDYLDKGFVFKIFFLIKYLTISLKIRILLKKQKINNVILYSMILSPLVFLLRKKDRKIFYSERNATLIIEKRKLLLIFYNMATKIYVNSINTISFFENIKYKKEIFLINNFLDNSFHKEFRAKLNFNLNNAVVLGRISNEKNQRVCAEYINLTENTSVHFYGNIKDRNYYKNLIEYIENYNLNNRIFFHDFEENQISVYEKFDIVIVPSFEEGISNVIIESLSMGKIVVCSNISQNQLFEKCCFYFDPKDSYDLYNVINKLKNMSSTQINKIIAKNVKWVNHYFNNFKTLNDYVELIEK